MPPEPPRPRAPSKPEIQAAEVDRTVGGAEHQRRFDLPKRAATLTGLPAPPALPLEHAATLPVPNPLQRLTVRRPTPPSTAIHARRSDPPAGAVSIPTSIRVPADETSPASLRKPSPLPAPSQRPDEGRIAAKDREIERLRRERDEARARPIIELAPDSEAPKGATKRDVRRALTGLLGGLTLLCSTIGIYIATRTEALKPKVDATATNTGINAADVTALTTRAAAIEKYERDKYDHDICVEQQLRAAIARGADHDLTTLPPGGTDWVQQHQPYRNRTAADPPAYIAIKPCPEAPKRP